MDFIQGLKVNWTVFNGMRQNTFLINSWDLRKLLTKIILNNYIIKFILLSESNSLHLFSLLLKLNCTVFNRMGRKFKTSKHFLSILESHVSYSQKLILKVVLLS